MVSSDLSDQGKHCVCGRGCRHPPRLWLVIVKWVLSLNDISGGTHFSVLITASVILQPAF